VALFADKKSNKVNYFLYKLTYTGNYDKYLFFLINTFKKTNLSGTSYKNFAALSPVAVSNLFFRFASRLLFI